MPRIVVIGGGIGGLTAALALRATGHEVLVLERAAQFGEVGAGVQLGPNATRVLHRLGLGDGLRPIGVTPSGFRFLRWADDSTLWEWPSGAAVWERFGGPYYTVYRPDLIELLGSALPQELIRFEARVTEVTMGGDGEPARLRLAGGEQVEADIVIGADGIHSVVRDATVGSLPARFSGMSAYRAVLPREAVAGDAGLLVRNWLGPAQHLVAYPVGAGASRYNLVCVVPDSQPSIESWTRPGDPDELRAHFAGWSPALRALLDAIDEPVYRWALHDRKPLERWSTRNTTLLGDAAHPMLPFMAQGAAQAIEDAATLATRLVESPGDPARALREYEQIRQPHTARVQELAWGNNTVFHLPDGPQQRGRDDKMASADGALTTGQLDWLFGNDPYA
jgi:salicylate hydroxylase